MARKKSEVTETELKTEETAVVEKPVKRSSELGRQRMAKINASHVPSPAAASSTAEWLLQLQALSMEARRDDPDTMWNCFGKYIELCVESGKPVGNMAAYLAMGINRYEANDWRTGVRRKADPRYKQLIQNVDTFCAVARETAAANGDVNVVWSIFCAKNYDGMRDQQDVVVQNGGESDELRNVEEIRRKYENISEE